MNPASVVTSELVEYCKGLNTIVILGYTKTGKHTIAKRLAEELQCNLYVSDDYLDRSNPTDSLYTLIEAFASDYRAGRQFVVEGVLCFRLLRKGLELRNFFPDLLIKTECNVETISHFYHKDGEGHKLQRALNFNKGLEKIWDEYRTTLRTTPGLKIPQYLEFNTSL